MSDGADLDYSGIDNLEVLAGAHNYNRFLVEAALAARSGSVRWLDFGAGNGILAAAWAARGIQVSCVEPDPRLRHELARQGLHAVSSLEAVADAAFEIVSAVNVLEHIEDDSATLQALARKLVPDGRIFVWVPAFPLLYSSMDRKVGHWRRYRKATLQRAATRAGLRIVSIRYADSLGFFASLLYKLFGSARGDVSPAAVRLYDRFVFPASRLFDRASGGRVLGKNLMAVLERAPHTKPHEL